MTEQAVPAYRAISLQPAVFPPNAWSPTLHSLFQNGMVVRATVGAQPPDYVRITNKTVPPTFDLFMPVVSATPSVADPQSYSLSTTISLMPFVPTGDVVVKAGRMQGSVESNGLKGRIT